MKNLTMCLIIILMTSVCASAERNFNSNRDTMIINISAKAISSDCAQFKPGPLAVNSTKVNNPEISVYPNPASNNLTIKSKAVLTTKSDLVSLYIIDMKGRVVLEQKDICPANSFYQKDLNVRGLPKGEYILKLVIGKHTCTRIFEVYY
jgi:hypothetical protein